jgi:protein TonB
VNPGVTSGNVRYRPKPGYPLKADLLRIQGAVLLRIVIGRDGGVEVLEVESGPPELAEEAVDSVRQWRYRPYLLNGEPVEVETAVTIRFHIQD